MDTRFLESLLAVVETGSIAAAARQQGLTAAAISQRIKVLETELNCALLVRSAKRVKPTAACQRLLPAASALVRDANRLSLEVSEHRLSGPYRIGSISTALLDVLPSVVREFRAKAPDVQLTVRPGSSQSLYEDLLSETVDAVICVQPPFALPKGIQSFQIVEEPFLHIRPVTHLRTFENGDLPWIIYDRSSWGGRLASPYLDHALAQMPVLCELDSPETIAAMVQEGLGQAAIPRWAGLEVQYSDMCTSATPIPSIVHRSIVLLQRSMSSLVEMDLLLKNTALEISCKVKKRQ
ncbi:LysR family transcriptional regulator [Roseibium sp.]|uniref:LysR family transcriptional regulator n=1 Tax=Roseibium sp. TaxID=1936156 RepID=UPI003D0CAF05